MREHLAETPMRDNPEPNNEMPDQLPVPGTLVPRLNETALLLDIDGTLLDLMPTPREVWVPPGLANTLIRLSDKTSGALALVSGHEFARLHASLRQFLRERCRMIITSGECVLSGRIDPLPEIFVALCHFSSVQRCFASLNMTAAIYRLVSSEKSARSRERFGL